MDKNKKKRSINIGTVFFGALLLYLIITLFIYLTSNRVTSYLVTNGTLTSNETYTALVLRSESLEKSTANGYLNYLVPSHSRTNKSQAVAQVLADKDESLRAKLTAEDLSALKSIASTFSKAYKPVDYKSVYDLRFNIKSEMLQNGEKSGLSGIILKASSDGILSNTYDGMENLTAETFNKNDFNAKTYMTKRISPDQEVAAGDPVYRLVHNDHWSIVIPISERQYANLSSRENIRVKFNKDNLTEKGSLKLLKKEDGYYAHITFYNGLVRYCDDRYLDVELLTTTETGLKVPLSSVITKDFYIIPADFLTRGGDSGAEGFIKRGEDKDTFTPVEIYEKIDSQDGKSAVYYIEKRNFAKGDTLIKPNSATTYKVGETASLDGVYSVNRGYAEFRKIVIIDQNEEYCLVETGTPYGIAQYDYIVKDGDKVREEDVLF